MTTGYLPGLRGLNGVTDLTSIQSPTLGSFRRTLRARGRAGGGRAGCGSVCNAHRPGHLRSGGPRTGSASPSLPGPLPGCSGKTPRDVAALRRPTPPRARPGAACPAPPPPGAGTRSLPLPGRPWGEPPQPPLRRPQQGLPPEGLLCRPPPARLPASTHHITDGGDVSDSHESKGCSDPTPPSL